MEDLYDTDSICPECGGDILTQETDKPKYQCVECDYGTEHMDDLVQNPEEHQRAMNEGVADPKKVAEGDFNTGEDNV